MEQEDKEGMAAGRSAIAVLDMGSQYAHLIAKRLRMLGYWSEIKSPSADCSQFARAKGIIISGGPASVYGDAPQFNRKILDLDIPILGLCYGHQLMAHLLGGKVERAHTAEFGFAQFEPTNEGRASPLLAGVEAGQVWMSHGDEVTAVPEGFAVIGRTKDCAAAALEWFGTPQGATHQPKTGAGGKRYSLQFHPEVKDTLCGNTILANFASICGMERNWDEDCVMASIIEEIRAKVLGEHSRKVLLFLSGGVDSTVSFALLNKALGKESVLGLHIDNGFMRKGESQAVSSSYHAHGMDNFISVDESEEFLRSIAGLTDPQAKREAVGETFVRVRDKAIAEHGLGDEGEWMLAQGTLYPDIIESGGTDNSRTIKTHHNRVAGIRKLIDAGLVIEPLRDLYKDEVRHLGRKLGLDDSMVMRHPFPGPGLSINVLCSDGTAPDADEMAAAREELDSAVLDMFCEDCSSRILRSILPVRSVGVQGDYRTYRLPAVLTFLPKTEGGGLANSETSASNGGGTSASNGGGTSAIQTAQDGYYRLPKKWEKLEAASNAVTNGAQHINRTVLCLYRKADVGEDDIHLQKAYCDKGNLDQLREADAIMLDALHKSGWYSKVFQHLTIRLPYASKAGRASFVLRPVVSEDVMTARFAPLPQDLLMDVVHKIAALPFTDAVYFDITGKPPATFGWE